MSKLREAVNARERELLAEVQVQRGSRQEAVDEALRNCEQTWRALTQLQASMSSDGGQNADDDDFLLEFNTHLTMLSHIPELPNADLTLHLSIEHLLGTLQHLAFAIGDDALYMAWKDNTGHDVGSRQADQRVKELAAQLQMVSADNARREDELISADKRIRQMEEANAAHAAEELRLQVLVERLKKHVHDLQLALESMTVEMKDKELQHRKDIVEMQELSTEKESLLMTLMQVSRVWS